MKFYWYDHRSAGGASPELDGLQGIVHLFTAEKIDQPTEFTGKQTPKLGFIHAGNEPGTTTSRAWEQVAEENAWIVRVSSDAIGQNGVPAHVHRLRTPCKVIAAYLTNDVARAFIESCNKGSPDFELLYLRPTDNLVALYLLEIVNLDTEEIKATKKLIRQEAENEYLEIKGAGSTLPTDRTTLLATLREILSPAGAQ